MSHFKNTVQSLKKVGHDLDQALALGLKDVFASAQSLWCTQHIQSANKEKLRKLKVSLQSSERIMADIYGCQSGPLEQQGLTDAQEEQDFNVKLESLQTV